MSQHTSTELCKKYVKERTEAEVGIYTCLVYNGHMYIPTLASNFYRAQLKCVDSFNTLKHMSLY